MFKPKAIYTPKDRVKIPQPMARRKASFSSIPVDRPNPKIGVGSIPTKRTSKTLNQPNFLLHEKFGLGGSGAIEPAKDEGNRGVLAQQQRDYDKILEKKRGLERQAF